MSALDDIVVSGYLHVLGVERYHKAAAAELKALRARLERAEAVLRRLERAGGDDAGYMCPVCGYGTLPGDHAPDCALAAVLKEAK